MIRDARDYKREYVKFLLTSPQLLTQPAARKEARHKLGGIFGDPLQLFEDRMSVHTLAWCRLVAQTHVKQQHELAGRWASAEWPSADDAPEIDESSDLAKVAIATPHPRPPMHSASAICHPLLPCLIPSIATSTLSQVEALNGAMPAADPRVLAAPDGYVTRVVDVRLEGFVLRLIPSLNATEQVEKGLFALPAVLPTPPASQRQARRGCTRGPELMTLAIRGVAARLRTLKAVGSSTHLAISSFEVAAGPAAFAPEAQRHASIIRIGSPSPPDGGGLHGAGEAAEGAAEAARAAAEGAVEAARAAADDAQDDTRHDTRLGGPASYPGGIEPFLQGRREAHGGNVLSRAAAAARRRWAGGSGARESGGEGDGVDEPSGGAPTAVAAATSATEGSDEPAILVYSLASSVDVRPHEMRMVVAAAEVTYEPPFFVAIETFLRPLEFVKWSSQLGATAMLRLKRAKIHRSADKLMREGWHMPQIKMMTVFLELGDFLGLPSSRHKLDLRLGGFRFALKDDGTGGKGGDGQAGSAPAAVLTAASASAASEPELMMVVLPPMNVTKAPRVGSPLPPTQRMAFRFDGPVEVESVLATGAFQRAMQIHTNSSGATRLGGTRDTLTAEVRSLHAAIRNLEAEKERLELVHDKLRAETLAAALGVVEAQAASTPEYAPLYDSRAMAEAVAAPEPEATVAAAELSAIGEVDESLRSMDRRMEEVLEYVRWKRRRSKKSSLSRFGSMVRRSLIPFGRDGANGAPDMRRRSTGEQSQPPPSEPPAVEVATSTGGLSHRRTSPTQTPGQTPGGWILSPPRPKGVVKAAVKPAVLVTQDTSQSSFGVDGVVIAVRPAPKSKSPWYKPWPKPEAAES